MIQMDLKHLIIFFLCVSSTVLTVCSFLANQDVLSADQSHQTVPEISESKSSDESDETASTVVEPSKVLTKTVAVSAETDTSSDTSSSSISVEADDQTTSSLINPSQTQVAGEPENTVTSSLSQDGEPSLQSTDTVTSELSTDTENGHDTPEQSNEPPSTEDESIKTNLPPTPEPRVVSPVQTDENLPEPSEDISHPKEDETLLAPKAEEPPVVDVEKEGKVDDPDDKENKDEFPSFTEWTQKVLAEQEKSKQDGQGDVPVPGKVAKRKLNFASRECGAKIIAYNSEAEKVKSVLTASKDEYMINPCSAKKWFVVELCEPVHIKSVDLASFELFSSQLKSFRISISDRYPAKEWKDMGTYDVLEERTVQSFPMTEDPEYFSKFIKVELLEHYGNEHYCPLTFFRVYGIAVDYDDDDLETPTIRTGQETEADEVVDDGEDEKTENVNLFTSAKDTVVNILKKVLNVEEPLASGDTEHIDNDSKQLNVSSEGTADSFMLPCVPEVSIQDSDTVSEDTETTADVTQPQPIYPTVEQNGLGGNGDANEADNMDDSVEDADSNYDDDGEHKDTFVRKLEDDEQIPSESQKENKLVTLLKSASSATVTDDWSSCFTCQACASKKSLTSRQCAYLQLFTSVGNQTEPGVRTRNVTASVLEQENAIETAKSQVSDARNSTDVPASSTEEENSAVESASTQNDQDMTSVKPTDCTTTVTEESTFSSFVVTDEVNIEPTSVLSVTSSEIPPKQEESASPKMSPDTMLLESSSTVQVSQPGGETEPLVLPAEQMTSSAFTGDNTFTAEKHIEQVTAEHHLPEAITVHDNMPQVETISTQTASTTISEEPPTATNVPVTVSSIEEEKPLDLVKVPVHIPMKRESAIMRLNNRIKSLELNVSLSSRFLEELSQRYRKQSDDMMKLLNKTLAKLNNVTKTTENADMVREERISVLEAQVENLTAVVVHLSENLEILNEQLTERQMLWTTLQGIILLVMLVLFLRRGKSHIVSGENRKLIEKMPTQPPLSPQRRNSMSQLSTPVKMIGMPRLKKHSSETQLCPGFTDNMVVETKIPLLFETALKDGHRRKKKKKHKRMGSKSSIQLEDKPRLDDVSPCLNSAGLLFGAENDGKADDCSPVSLSRSSSGGGISMAVENFSCKNVNVKQNLNVTKPVRPPPPKLLTRTLSNERQMGTNFLCSYIGTDQQTPGIEDVKRDGDEINGHCCAKAISLSENRLCKGGFKLVGIK